MVNIKALNEKKDDDKDQSHYVIPVVSANLYWPCTKDNILG